MIIVNHRHHHRNYLHDHQHHPEDRPHNHQFKNQQDNVEFDNYHQDEGQSKD